MTCPICKSDEVSHGVGGQGVVYECHNCGHGWLEEFKNGNVINQSISDNRACPSRRPDSLERMDR